MTKLSYLEAIHQAMHQAMEKDDDVFVLGEDVGKKGGVFGVTLGLQERFGIERVIDTPLAESNIVGTAIGAAMMGKRPVAEIQFAEYIFPSSPYDAKGLLLASIESNDPVLYFEHKKAYRLLKEEVPEDYYTVPLYQADVKREGHDLTVFTYGLCVNYSIQAADALADEGIDVEVVDLRTVYPLDKETIIERAKHTGKILLITEDNLEGSVMSEVAAIIAENCLFDLDAPIMRLAGPDVPSMPFSPPLEDEFMINPDKIKNKMRELAEF